MRFVAFAVLRLTGAKQLLTAQRQVAMKMLCGIKFDR